MSEAVQVSSTPDIESVQTSTDGSDGILYMTASNEGMSSLAGNVYDV